MKRDGRVLFEAVGAVAPQAAKSERVGLDLGRGLHLERMRRLPSRLESGEALAIARELGRRALVGPALRSRANRLLGHRRAIYRKRRKLFQNLTATSAAKSIDTTGSSPVTHSAGASRSTLKSTFPISTPTPAEMRANGPLSGR